MATRIFVIKEVRSSGEPNDPVPEYDETRYVAAVREGVSYDPSNVYDLRGNLLSLANYVKKYCPAFADRPGLGSGDGKLWLINDLPDDRRGGETQRTHYALLIFGKYIRGLVERQARLEVDLSANETWQKVKTIYCGAEGWSAKFVTRKFGTDHKKLFLMIAPKNFSGMIDGHSADLLERSPTEINRSNVDDWIRMMNSAPGADSRPAQPAPHARPLTDAERDHLYNIPLRGHGGGLVQPTMPGNRPGQTQYFGGLRWTWNAGRWQQG